MPELSRHLGKNATSFSKDYQPGPEVKRGRKNTSEIRKLMSTLGNTLAPEDLLEDATVRHFLDQNGLKGTVNEVLIARLYALALYTGNLNAIKLILETLSGKHHGGKRDNKGTRGGIIINFVAPPIQEAPIDIDSDSWTATPKNDEESDTH